MKIINKSVIATTFIGLFLSTTANSANLIINGGFEDNTVNNGNGGWQWFNASDVNGWNGSNIEIWNNHGSIGSYEGNQHAELNAHPNTGTTFSIFQTFDTTIGNSYEFSFAYAARAKNNEKFSVKVVGSEVLFNKRLTDHQVNQWRHFAGNFTADSNKTTLRFTTIRPSTGTVGNFLDAVNVEEVTNVSEPSSLALISAGMISLVLSRRKSADKLS